MHFGALRLVNRLMSSEVHERCTEMCLKMKISGVSGGQHRSVRIVNITE